MTESQGYLVLGALFMIGSEQAHYTWSKYLLSFIAALWFMLGFYTWYKESTYDPDKEDALRIVEAELKRQRKVDDDG